MEIIQTALQTCNKFTVLGQAAVVGNWAGDRYFYIVPFILCGFIHFLDQPCHHIYCPSKTSCQTPIYFFPLVLVHCPTPLFVAVVWLSFKFCLSNLPCLVLPLLLDILAFVQFQAPFSTNFFCGNRSLLVICTTSLISILSGMSLQYFKLNF